MTTAIEDTIQTINLQQEIEIDAPVEIAFEAMLEELGPGSILPDGTPFPMKLELWPGGRWFRDLGNNTGHFWGVVQVIKPPPHPKPLLEICGPMFMSYPGTNFIQYRLIPEGSKTKLQLTHRAMGLIPEDVRKGVVTGWAHGLKRVRELAERRMKSSRAAR